MEDSVEDLLEHPVISDEEWVSKVEPHPLRKCPIEHRSHRPTAVLVHISTLHTGIRRTELDLLTEFGERR